MIRSKIIEAIRQFMTQRQFMEVETPMMLSTPGGATAAPFVTHYNALGIDMFLRVAPELNLKRLVVGGFERVFETNRKFRNEGMSRKHSPEFTMLEFYQSYSDYNDLMDLTEELLRGLCEKVIGTSLIQYPVTERNDEAGFLRQRYKLGRRHYAAFGMAPAHQSFVAGDGFPCEIIKRLKIQFELIGAYCTL